MSTMTEAASTPRGVQIHLYWLGKSLRSTPADKWNDFICSATSATGTFA